MTVESSADKMVRLQRLIVEKAEKDYRKYVMDSFDKAFQSLYDNPAFKGSTNGPFALAYKEAEPIKAMIEEQIVLRLNTVKTNAIEKFLKTFEVLLVQWPELADQAYLDGQNSVEQG